MDCATFIVVVLLFTCGKSCCSGFLHPDRPGLETFLQVQRDPTPLRIQFNLNKFFDYIIETMKYVMSDTGDLTVPLPDISRSLNRGLIRGSGGYLSNIASLRRTDDAQLVMNGTVFYLNASLGLDQFDAGFRNYTIELGDIYQTGKVSFRVPNNSLKMVLSFDLVHVCSLRVESIKFDELQGLEIEVIGLGDFESLVRIVTDWIVQSFKNTIRTAVNSKLEASVNAALKRFMGTLCMDH